ncbi:acetyltransferase [Lactobacillus rhamnosus]|nr:acetyltransferase [Lacticaseibacillus rhamnosus]
MTRSPAQKPAHKGLGRNGQNGHDKAAYAPVSKTGWFALPKKKDRFRPFPY